VLAKSIVVFVVLIPHELLVEWTGAVQDGARIGGKCDGVDQLRLVGRRSEGGIADTEPGAHSSGDRSGHRSLPDGFNRPAHRVSAGLQVAHAFAHVVARNLAVPIDPDDDVASRRCDRGVQPRGDDFPRIRDDAQRWMDIAERPRGFARAIGGQAVRDDDLERSGG
jgi:hypothetical protein